MPIYALPLALLLAAAASPAETVSAETWPQWGGPGRDFQVDARPLASSWPENGPPRLWSRPLGPGYSGIVSDGERLYTLYRLDGEKREAIVALDAQTGKTLWQHTLDAELWAGFNPQFGRGPHSTPTLAGERLCAAGVRAVVVCLDRQSGEKLWSFDLWDELEAQPPDRGYASSPLELGDRLIVAVPGKEGGLAALNLETGKLVWRSPHFPYTAFSSPTVIQVDGLERLVAFASAEIVILDPADGSIDLRHPHETQYGINASTPIWGRDSLLFVSAAYDSGSRVLQLTRDGDTVLGEEVWANRKMELHHGSAVRLGQLVVGSSGDFGPAFLTGIDVTTGEVAFKERGFAKANLVAVGQHVLILDEDGDLALAELEEGEVKILARASVLEARAWTAPTLVGTTLYLRDQRQIVALDLSPAAL